MRIYFSILLLIISFLCNAQVNKNDSLIKEYNKLSLEIDSIEKNIMELSRRDDSIYSFIINKKGTVNNINPDFKYSEFIIKYNTFKAKYQALIYNGQIPSVLPINVSDVRLIIGYGEKVHPILGTTRFHYGIDIPAPKGTLIKSTIDGEVAKIINDFGGFGKQVIIKNSQEVEILYAHLDSVYLTVGQKIKIGQNIGTVGSSGTTTAAGLHYEIRGNNEYINPVFTFSEGLSEDELKYLWEVKEYSLD